MRNEANILMEIMKRHTCYLGEMGAKKRKRPISLLVILLHLCAPARLFFFLTPDNPKTSPFTQHKRKLRIEKYAKLFEVETTEVVTPGDTLKGLFFVKNR